MEMEAPFDGLLSRQNIKTSFPNRCSGIFLVESIEGLSKKQDKISKQTSDHQTNQSGRSKRSLHESQENPRGERDVIPLRNPTEDKRAFRRMLTSADPPQTAAENRTTFLSLCVCGLTNKPIMYKKFDNT